MLRGLSLVVAGMIVAGAAPVPWSDPPILAPGPSGIVALDALVGDVDVPGLGRVRSASFYDITQGPNSLPGPRRRSLMPPVLQLAPGRTLELHLHNRLTTVQAADLGSPHPPRSPDPTNVHTHGFLVPPTGTGFGTPHPRLGDCVLPLAASTAASTAADPASPAHSGHGAPASPSVALAADPCASDTLPAMPIAAALTYAYPIAADHPSGLFWIHPHPHGQSEIQLSNGLSGLVSIGSVWDSLYFGCRPSASPSTGPGACRTQEDQRREMAVQARAKAGAVRVRYFGLKDIQVQPHPGAAPSHPDYDLIPFPRRPDGSDDAFSTANDARKSRCGDLARPQGDDDVLLPPGSPAPRGLCRGADGAAWVFTVSGQVFPKIEVRPGITELWRIANMSADVSYRLQLKGADGTLYPMRPVAIDGVVIAAPQPDRPVGMAAGQKGASTSGNPVTEIVLMPSARIEIVVERCPGRTAGCVPPDREVRAVLHTRGMATGTGDNGDKWPAVDLAEIVFEAGASRGTPLPERQALLPPLRAAAALTQPSAPPAPAPAAGSPQPAAPASSCTYDHGPGAFPVAGTQVRLIRLDNDNFKTEKQEAFGIHDELFGLSRLSGGGPITIAALLDEGAAAATGPSLISDIRLPDPCTDIATLAGFRDYYRPFDPAHDNVTARHGTEEYWLVVNDSPECHNFHIHQMKFSVIDADFRGTAAAQTGGSPLASDQCAGDRTAIRPINQAAFLDNYPMPPASRVLLRIRFDGPKLGRFVFHCHILEHEDKGMMALLNVVE